MELKDDILTITQKRLINIFEMYISNEEVRETVLTQMRENIKDIRKEYNGVHYVQVDAQKWEQIINLWEQFYELKCINGVITKNEAYESIRQEVVSLIGSDQLSNFTIEHIIKNKEKYKNKISKKDPKEDNIGLFDL